MKYGDIFDSVGSTKTGEEKTLQNNERQHHFIHAWGWVGSKKTAPKQQNKRGLMLPLVSLLCRALWVFPA